MFQSLRTNSAPQYRSGLKGCRPVRERSPRGEPSVPCPAPRGERRRGRVARERSRSDLRDFARRRASPGSSPALPCRRLPKAQGGACVWFESGRATLCLTRPHSAMRAEGGRTFPALRCPAFGRPDSRARACGQIQTANLGGGPSIPAPPRFRVLVGTAPCPRVRRETRAAGRCRKAGPGVFGTIVRLVSVF